MPRLAKETRTCIVCKLKMNKQLMKRIVKDSNGQVKIDLYHKLGGRGLYICNDPNCLAVCQKKHMLNKVLKCDVDKIVYDNLK